MSDSNTTLSNDYECSSIIADVATSPCLEQIGATAAVRRARSSCARAQRTINAMATQTDAKDKVGLARTTLLIDCASEVDICSAYMAARAVRRESIPAHARPIIGGTNSGDPIRGTEYCWFFVFGRLTRFVTGPEFRYNLLSTNTTSRLRLHTVIRATTNQLEFIPVGESLDMPANPILAIPVGKLWAIPNGLQQGTLDDNVDGRYKAQIFASPSTNTIPHGRDNDNEHGAERDDSERVATRSSTTVSRLWARALLGNPSSKTMKTVAKRVRSEVRIPRDDDVDNYYDRQYRHANGKARRMVHVGKAAGQVKKVTVVCDMIGGQQPVSKNGNRSMWSWTIVERNEEGVAYAKEVYVTFAPRGNSAHSLAGFEHMCREAGLTVYRDAVAQSFEIICDNGTEFLGVFLQAMQRAGITVSNITAHSKQKGLVGIAESSNACIQQTMRATIAIAEPNLRSFGIDPSEWWDYAARHGVLQKRWLKKLLHGEANYRQTERKLAAPFGAIGEVALMIGGPSRQKDKQQQRRMVSAIFMGVMDDGRRIMMTKGGEIYRTMHVAWGADAMPAAPVRIIGEVQNNEQDETQQHSAGATVEPDISGGAVATETDADDDENTNTDNTDTVAVDVNGEIFGGCYDDDSNGSTDNMGDTHIDMKGCDSIAGRHRVTNDSGYPQMATGKKIDDADIQDDDIEKDYSLTATTAIQPQDRSGTGSQVERKRNTITSDVVGRRLDCYGNDTLFYDQHGNKITIGDHVRIKCRGASTCVDGIITRINGGSHDYDDGRCEVAHADGTNEVYPIYGPRENCESIRWCEGESNTHDVTSTNALTRSNVSRVDNAINGAEIDEHPQIYRTMYSPKRRLTINPDVAKYIDDETGDIRQDIIDGVEDPPPQPELPVMDKKDEPPTPTTIQEALSSPLARYWLPAIIQEIAGHLRPTNRRPTYTYTTEYCKGGRQLHVKWVFVIKRHADGSIDKFKARAVLAGYWLKRGIDYVESYTGSSPWSDVLDLESLSVNLRLRNYEADLSQAYMFAPMPPAPNGEPVIAIMSPGVRTYNDAGQRLNLKVQQCWYGHPVSGFGLARLLHDRLLNRHLRSGDIPCPIPFEQCPTQPVIFRAQFPADHRYNGEIFWLHITTDNLRSYTSEDAIQTEFMDFLDSVFKTTGGRVALQDQQPQTFHGVRFSYQDGGVHMDMPAYINELLHETGLDEANASKTASPSGYRLSRQDYARDKQERDDTISEVNRMFRRKFDDYTEVKTWYGHLVSSIGWIAQKVGPSILYAHSVLCRVIAAPNAHAFRGVKHLLRFLAGKRDMHRAYYPSHHYEWRKGEFPAWSIMTDASFADDLFDRKSQGGYAGGFEGKSITTAASAKSPRVLTSTYQAESSFAGRAAKEVIYKRNLFRFLRVLNPGPTKMYVDNKATVLAAGAPIRKWSPASKQFDIEEKFIVECVERGIIEIHHKHGSIPEHPQPGDGFVADAMTKPMNAYEMAFYYPELHGRNSNSSKSRSAALTFYTSRGGEKETHFSIG